MKLRWLLLTLVAGCQCLEPVDEFPGEFPDDAGPVLIEDGGLTQGDGGASADAGVPECLSPTDCEGAFTPMRWCGLFGDGGVEWSCVNRRCVAQCAGEGGQTCEQSAPEQCLRCPPTATCIPADCGGGRNQRWRVEELSCRDGGVTLAEGDVLFERPGNGCGIPFSRQRDGGAVFATLYLQSARSMSADTPALGGLCLVNDLPTGAQRMAFDCPACQMVLMGLGQ